MLKPMLPTLTFEAPLGTNWVYEVKYDGYRAILHWGKEEILLISRNGNLLNEQFPEIIDFCKKHRNDFLRQLPLILDGELCILESPYKASFERIQQRGRLRSKDKIELSARNQPAYFLIFDLLEKGGHQLAQEKWLTRKEALIDLFNKVGLATTINADGQQLLQFITFEKDFDRLWRVVKEHHSEGVIASISIILYII